MASFPSTTLSLRPTTFRSSTHHPAPATPLPRRCAKLPGACRPVREAQHAMALTRLSDRSVLEGRSRCRGVSSALRSRSF